MSRDRATAASLRRAFDERFAAPADVRERAMERFILAGHEGARIALPLMDVARLHDAPQIVRVPDGDATLVGIAGLSGRVVPVFDLAMLLDAGATREARATVAVTTTAEPVGLLLTGDIGYAEVPCSDLDASIAGGRPHVHRLARVGDGRFPIVDVRSVVAEIAARAGVAR